MPGLTDKLLLLPLNLWLAYKTGRHLLIKCSKPEPLEEFLVLLAQGFDWRSPDGYLVMNGICLQIELGKHEMWR